MKKQDWVGKPVSLRCRSDTASAYLEQRLPIRVLLGNSPGPSSPLVLSPQRGTARKEPGWKAGAGLQVLRAGGCQLTTLLQLKGKSLL